MEEKEGQEEEGDGRDCTCRVCSEGTFTLK